VTSTRWIQGPLVLLAASIASPAMAGDPALTPAGAEHGEAGTAGRSPTAVASPVGTSPLDNALRLARMLGDDRTAAALLEQRALAPQAAWSDVTDAVDALEAAGDPERAARLLDRRTRIAPRDPRAFVALAELWTRSGHAARAVDAWRRLEAAAGELGADQALALATALDRTGHTDEALQALESARARAPDHAVEFWDALATLAWQSQADADALSAYRTLWAAGDRRTVVSQRLMTLSSEAGAYDEAVSVGTEGYRRSPDADLLLELASIQIAKEDWNGVVRTLALADGGREPFARSGEREEYWLTLAEAQEHLGDWRGARSSNEAALAIDPGSTAAKTALLDDAIARDDRTALRDYTDRWAAASSAAPALWGPLAVALDRVGRTREAFAFYARQVRSARADPTVILDFADALDRAGDALWAWRLRRYATGRLRDRLVAAARAPSPASDERALAESAAEVFRDISGAAVGERWFRAIVGARGPDDRRSEAFVADWCLHEDRLGCAGRVVAGALGRPSVAADAVENARWRTYGLQIALAESDLGEVKRLLASAAGLDSPHQIDALVALERDEAAAVAIAQALDTEQTRPQREEGPEQEETWRRQLAEIELRHAPTARAGVSYDFIDGLGVYGPDVGASHDVGSVRVLYGASARELSVQDGSLVQTGGPTPDVDVSVMARLGDPRGVEEIGAGIDYQPDTPLPRATLLGERLLTPKLGATVRLAVDDPVVDTGLLRLAGAQSIVELGARYEIGSVAYAQLDLHAREDHTRRFHHIATEIGGVAEVGYEILRAEPEWDVGVQALASQRENVGTLPSDIASFIPAAQRGGDLSAYLPPSFQLVSIVTHLTRGDFSERYRPERAVFPRYDCSAGAGLLLPDLDGAFEAQCSASVRVSGRGYVTAVGSFEQGVFGVANQTNAGTRVSFTQAF
jgi:tetratricopeptide (TPR) repeat protein